MDTDTVLTIAQTLSVIDLVVVGLLPRKHDNGLKPICLVLLIAGSLIYLLTTTEIGSRSREAEANNLQKIDRQTNEIKELRDKLYLPKLDQVMEAPKKVTPAPVQKPTEQIRITSPSDGSAVPPRPYLEGTISDAHANVWVIVHPMETGAYWIQPTVDVREDGAWKTMLYLGRSGDIDLGKHFEIMAIANPKEMLNEADVLDKWPDAQWKSHVIEVIRR